MVAYLVHYREYLKDVQILKFSDTKSADVYGFEKLPPDRSANIIESEDSFSQLNSGLIVDLYNALSPDKPVSKFESRSVAARRTFAVIYAKFNQLEFTEVTVDPSPPDDIKETTPMPKTAAAKKPRASGKAAGFAADFKPTRAGTARAKVLELMDGTRTPSQIAAEMGGRFDEKYVMAHAYCLRRDCGIGYELNKDGQLVAVYPARRSFADAIKQPAEKKAKSSEATPSDAPVGDPETEAELQTEATE